jgi:hypothetical protein
MTLSVDDVRALPRCAPVPLVTLTLMDGSVLHLSDRVITIGGVTYDSMVKEIGEIEESVERATSHANNSDFTMILRNVACTVGGTDYSSLIDADDAHPLDGAWCEVSTVLLEGGQVTPLVPLFVGVTEEPQNITRANLTLRCSSVPAYAAKQYGLAKLMQADYPLCLPSDSGKPFPELIGEFRTVEARRTKWPVYESDNETNLSAGISNSATTIPVVSTVGFGDYGDEEKVIWIEGERITWAAKTTTPQQFTGCTRGTAGGTAAASHASNAIVAEYPHSATPNAEVTAAGHELDSVTAVYGEFGDLLAPIPLADCAVTLSPARSYIVIPKASLVVPPTLVDSIQISGSSAAVRTRVDSSSGGFSGGADAGSFYKYIQFDPNPYLNAEGVPLYSDIKVMIAYSMTFGDPSSKVVNQYEHGMMPSFIQQLRFQIGNAATFELATGTSTWNFNRTDPGPNGSVHKVWPSVAAIPMPISWTNWTYPTPFTIYWNSQEHGGYSVSADVYLSMLLNANAVTKTGTVKDEKYFRRIYVSGWGRPSDNAIFGTVGEASRRPDHVMKRWIITNLGFDAADIDTASFDAAGTFYAAQSPTYELSVRVTEDVDPLEELYRMAFESRSVVYFALGKWYLKVIPSSAPAETKTVKAGDLSGEKSVFAAGKTKRADVKNSITLKWEKNDGPSGGKDPFKKSALVEDVVGDYPTLPEDLELRMVYGEQQARDVAAIYLMLRARPLKTIEFPVSWDNTDLQIGDTVLPEDVGFWDGVKFWLQSCRRGGGIVKATYTGIEWPA